MRKRRVTLEVEGLEPRDLLSSITDLLATSGSLHSSASASALPTPISVNPPPFVPGPGDPLPREVARERFRATFKGPFSVGPPLFTGQSKILHFRGLGTSNQFLHGDYQMTVILPKNASDPTTGGAYMQDKNINSGGAIAFDLKADPQSFDRFGRPTSLTFTINSNIYSGIFYNAIASGTVTIRYFKSTSSVLFDGLVFTNGISNPLRNYQ